MDLLSEPYYGVISFLSEVGQVMLYLDRDNPPFIYLEASGQKFYLNAEYPELNPGIV